MDEKFEFDGAKDRANISKHGISLSLAFLLFDGEFKERVDDRHDYGETRLIASGFIAGRLYVCIFTLREETRRIISLRRANKREINDHYKGKPEAGT